MKKKFLVLLTILSVFCAFGVMKVNAETIGSACGDNLTWTLDDEGVLTISGTGKMYEYSATTFPWNSLRSKIKEIVIEDGVTNINQYAFRICRNLTSVTIADSVTEIGMWAFESCESLKNIKIPDGITTIASSTFSCCNSLTEVIIPDSVTVIEYGAFSECNGLTSITVPESVTTIGDLAFGKCDNLASATILSKTAEFDGDRVFERSSTCIITLVIRGYKGSTTEKYANENEHIFRPLNETEEEIVTKAEGVLTKYIDDDNKATGFIATITNEKSTAEVIENAEWTITPENSTAVGILVELPTTLTLENKASVIIGIVLDGLYDENATAELAI